MVSRRNHHCRRKHAVVINQQNSYSKSRLGTGTGVKASLPKLWSPMTTSSPGLLCPLLSVFLFSFGSFPFSLPVHHPLRSQFLSQHARLLGPITFVSPEAALFLKLGPILGTKPPGNPLVPALLSGACPFSWFDEHFGPPARFGLII